MSIHNPTTINKSGSTPLAGNISLAQGSNITITQSGQIITIASSGGGSITGSGQADRNAFWTSNSNISYDDANTWDNTNKKVGYGTTTPRYRFDAVAATASIADMFAFAASLELESLGGAGTDTLVLIYGPQDNASDNATAETTYTAGTGYTNNDNVYGTLYAYITDPRGGTTVLASSTGVPLITSGAPIVIGSNPGAIQWNWNAATRGDGSAVSGYYLVIVDTTTSTSYTYDVGNVLTFYDSNDGGSFSDYTPFGTAFQSAGQMISYDLFGVGTSPSGNPYYGNSSNYTVTDGFNNGSYFWIQHTISGTSGAAWGENQNGTNSFTGTGNQTFYQSQNYSAGLISTQHYGFLSDGSTLNISYDSYARNPTLNIFSVNPINSTTVDPNDAQYYAIKFVSNFSVSDAKLIKNSSAGHNYNQNTFYEDVFGPTFGDGAGHTPTVSTTTTGIFENKSDTSNAYAQLILNSSALSNALAYFSLQKSGTEKFYIRSGANDYTDFLSTGNQFNWISPNSSAPEMYWKNSSGTIKAGMFDGNLGLGNTYQSNAYLFLGAGTTGITQIRFDVTSSFPSSAINGGMEYGSNNFFGSDSNVRRRFIRSATSNALTSNAIPKIDSTGFAIDSGILDNGTTITFSGSESILFANGFAVSTGKDISMGSGARIVNGLRTGFASAAVSTSLNVTNHSPIFVFTGSTAGRTLTLPTAVSISGTVFEISNEASVSVTVATTSSQNINIGLGTVTSVVLQPGDRIKLIATASSTWDATSYYQNIVLPANGGTGLSSYAVGDIVYASGTTTLAKLADVATGNALISGGVTTAPSWGKIALTTHVSGTLPVANGGTGQTTPVVVAGSFSGVGTATTTFTVTIGTTQANTTYKVNVTPTDLLAAAVFYVNNKTTTTFDVVYLAGLTGTVTFDWALFT